MQNAWNAYGEMLNHDPWSVASLSQEHAHLTDALIGGSGQFRTGGVAVLGSDGTLLHRGALSAQVPAHWWNSCWHGAKPAKRTL